VSTMDADLLIEDVNLATMRGESGCGEVREGAVAIARDRIAWAGARDALPAGLRPARSIAGRGRWLLPGLVDCHTHLVYAGSRAREFERRLAGVSYAEIAREGGGIMATVRATRAAGEDALAGTSAARMEALARDGATTVEVKSGYGLATAHELKQLAAARTLGTRADVDVRGTLLGAHALPPEFAGRADDYVDLVCREMIPAAAASGLADAVDAFCETIGFTAAQTRRVFEAACAQGLRVKLHADQLSDGGGAALAAAFGALSADHLEHASEEGVAAMARAGTVAVLLPGAYYFLREKQLPPVDALRRHRVPIALATDCNPGTSPATSLTLIANMGCTLFRLTVDEALRGISCNAARALGLADRGVIEPGWRADLALFDVAEPAEIAYRIGGVRCAGRIRGGRVLHWED
jgi:imidazolonepropionase